MRVKTFAQYIKSLQDRKDEKLRLVSEQLPQSIVALSSAPVTQGTIRSSEAQEFAYQVTQLVESEEFVNELSDEIGTPETGESEEEFVERASNVMRKLLRKRLSK